MKTRIPQLLVALLVTTAAAFPQEETPAQLVTIDFSPDGLAFDKAIIWAAKSTGCHFLYRDELTRGSGNLRLSGPIEVPAERLLEFWQSVFVANGFALIPISDKVGRLMLVERTDQSRSLKQSARYVPCTELERFKGRIGEVVMTSIPLEHVAVSQVRQAVQQILANRNAEYVQEVQSANALVVVGFAPTVNSIYQLLKLMDVPPRAFQTTTRRFPLHHARAKDALPLVRDLLMADAQTGPGRVPQMQGVYLAPVELRIVADAESNAIIARGSESDLVDVEAVLAEIDKPEATGAKVVGVISLKYARARDVAAVIEELVAAPRPPSKKGPARARPQENSQERITVVADERTNSLLVHGDAQSLEAIKALVKTLDVEVKQSDRQAR